VRGLRIDRRGWSPLDGAQNRPRPAADTGDIAAEWARSVSSVACHKAATHLDPTHSPAVRYPPGGRVLDRKQFSASDGASGVASDMVMEPHLAKRHGQRISTAPSAPGPTDMATQVILFFLFFRDQRLDAPGDSTGVTPTCLGIKRHRSMGQTPGHGARRRGKKPPSGPLGENGGGRPQNETDEDGQEPPRGSRRSGHIRRRRAGPFCGGGGPFGGGAPTGSGPDDCAGCKTTFATCWAAV